MATVNKNLESLTEDDVIRISEHYLMGWHNIEKEFGFRVKGLNKRRAEMGLTALDKNVSLDYRLAYITSHYSSNEIHSAIENVLKNSRVAENRWSGIELLDCRFGRDYIRAFRHLLGSSEYRKLSEKYRVDKLKETQTEKYGGVGLAGKDTAKKAIKTNTLRYGVSNPMQSDEIKQTLLNNNKAKFGGVSPFNSADVRAKAIESRDKKIHSQMNEFRKNGSVSDLDCFESEAEKIVFGKLVSRFGKNDVFYQYGIHPADKRYPFNCDFYIKSLDLFIELNGHYSHHTHWFDANNPDDILRKKHLLDSGKKRSINAVKVWCDADVNKRACAKKNALNYLVFWDGSNKQINKQRIPALRDFYEWFDTYDCDTNAFLNAHPENTY